MKQIIVAKSAGFCFGVSRSVDMAEKLLAEEGSACSLGPIIHNEDVVEELARRTGLTKRAVHMRIFRTRERLRAYLTERGYRP